MEIQQQQNKPYVYLNEDNSVLTIKGASYPEHANSFYEPILNHIINWTTQTKSKEITVNLAMILMNSISEKCVFKILTILKDVNNLTVNWYYEYDDEDMFEEGKMWENALEKIKFNMHCVEDIDNLQL